MIARAQREQAKSIHSTEKAWGICVMVAGCLFSLFCFLKAIPGSPLRAGTVGTQQHSRGHATVQLGFKTRNIEDIRVGDRVLADNPEVDSPSETQVNPVTWRKLVLRAEHHCSSGTLDDINIETLQPTDWIAANRVCVGAAVPLPLDLVEMGLPEDLRATVVAIESCPPIRSGPGRVVLTTVNRLNQYVLELTVRDVETYETTIRATGFHKFFRVNDRDWISAEELRPDDHLQGVGGLATVVSKRQVPGTFRVYNLSIEGEHVYNVAGIGVLVHNNSAAPAAPSPQKGLYGSKKHGVNWKEAKSRAKMENTPQGKFGSAEDVDYAASQANGQPGQIVSLPKNHTSTVTLPNGNTYPANAVIIWPTPSGTLHMYPILLY